MPLFVLLAAIPIAAFVLARTTVAPLRKVGRAVLLLYVVAGAVLTAGMASVPLWTRPDAGIGSAVFLLFATVPALLTWLGWSLYRSTGNDRDDGDALL